MGQVEWRGFALGVDDVGHVDAFETVLRVKAVGVGADQKMDDRRIRGIAGKEWGFRVGIAAQVGKRREERD